MMPRILTCLLFIAIIGGDRLYCQAQTTTQPAAASLFEPRVLQSDEQKIIIEIDAPPLRILSGGMSAADGQLLSLSGYSLSAEPGAPQLPLRGLTIGLPENAKPTLQILDQESELHEAENIQPAPSIVYDRKLAADGISVEPEPRARYVYEKNAAIYERNAFYPTAPVQLGDLAIMRGHRLLTVQVFPVLANPVNGRLKYYKKLRFAIYFDAPTTAPRPSVTTDDKYFEPVFQSTVLNYETAKNWKIGRDKSLRKSANNSSYFLDEGSEWYKIMTDKPGIFKVDKAALDAAGLNTSAVDPRTIKMFNRGVEVAIYLSGEDDGSFDAGDYIEFYADKFKNFYTETNIYWLTVGSSVGKRMAVVDGTITGSNPVLTRGKELYHYEKDVGHRADYPGHTDNTTWWMTAIIAPETETHTLNLGSVSDTSVTDCSFWIKGQGMTGTDTNPDHHTKVEINDSLLFDEYWDGRVFYSKTVNFPQAWLAPGDNNFNLIGPGDTGSSIDYFYVDFINIEYWRDYVAANDSIFFSAAGSGAFLFHLHGFGSGSSISLFDVTDSTNVKRIGNSQRVADSLRFQYSLANSSRFIAVADAAKNQATQIIKDENSNLRSTSHQVDYIVISHPDFMGPAQRLAAYRQEQGFSTLAVTTTNVYDEFNNGFYDAHAIKDFLAYTYNNWGAPSPAYVVLVGDASWNPRIMNPGFFGDEKSDFVPTRFFEAHEDNFEAASDSWFGQIAGNDVLPEMMMGRLSARTVDHADAQVNKIINYETDFSVGLWNRTATFCADNGEGGVLAFEDSSDAFINDLVPKTFNINRVYLQQLGTEGARTATKNAFDDGTLIMNYYGHGSSTAWAAEGFFNRDDVPDLRNDNKSPFILTLSCINGYFVNPKDADKCLGETLERERQRGSIGIFTGAGEAYPSPVLALGRKIWGSLFQDQNKTLGPLTNAGIVDMLSRYPDMWDHAMFYILFGDPATTLHYQPSVNFASGGFEGAVLANGEPPAIGNTLLAVRDSQLAAKFTITDKKGAFGPLYIDADDPNTPLKDGAVDGDSIRFSLARAGLDTIILYPAAAWKSGKVQKISLSNFPTRVESAPDITLYVDEKKVGDGVYDGDVISKNSLIAAKMSSDAKYIDVSSIRLRLNRALLDPDQYSIVPDKNDPHHISFLRFQPATLSDGEYEIAVEAVDNGALHVLSQKSFSFSIQSELALSDVVNFPNPMQKETRFTYVLANDKAVDVQIKIYTVAGRLIRSIDAVGQVAYNEIWWDGVDAYGDELANGVYFYKISARDGDETSEIIERLVVMN